jgi:Na+-translocating ferredoxin:NAD+ oxidoreductase RnfG subunit
VSDIIRSIAMWTLLCLGAGAVALFSHSYFRPLSTARATMEVDSAVRRLFAPGVGIREVPGKKPFPATYWIGKRDSVTVGYAFPGESRGPSGAIDFVAGIDTAGTIIGVTLAAERRIPGQGLSLEDRFTHGALWRRLVGRADTVRPWFIEQFAGTAAAKPFVIDTAARESGYSAQVHIRRREENRISAFTGATVSTQAIARDIQKSAASFFQNIRRREQ